MVLANINFETYEATITAPKINNPTNTPTATNANDKVTGTKISRAGKPITTRTKLTSVANTGINKIKKIVLAGIPLRTASCTQKAKKEKSEGSSTGRDSKRDKIATFSGSSSGLVTSFTLA